MLLAASPNTKLEHHPLSGVRDSLFNIHAVFSISYGWIPHPQPDDAPCHCDRDPLNMDKLHIYMYTNPVYLKHVQR